MDRLQYTQGAESDKLRLLIQSRKLNQSYVGIIVKIGEILMILDAR